MDVLFPIDVIKKRTFKGVIKKSILVDSMISEMRKTIKFQEIPGKQKCIEDLNTRHILETCKIELLVVLFLWCVFNWSGFKSRKCAKFGQKMPKFGQKMPKF